MTPGNTNERVRKWGREGRKISKEHLWVGCHYGQLVFNGTGDLLKNYVEHTLRIVWTKERNHQFAAPLVEAYPRVVEYLTQVTLQICLLLVLESPGTPRPWFLAFSQQRIEGRCPAIAYKLPLLKTKVHAQKGEQAAKSSQPWSAGKSTLSDGRAGTLKRELLRHPIPL